MPTASNLNFCGRRDHRQPGHRPGRQRAAPSTCPTGPATSTWWPTWSATTRPARGSGFTPIRPTGCSTPATAPAGYTTPWAPDRDPEPGGGRGGRGAGRRHRRGAEPDRHQPHRGQLRDRLAGRHRACPPPRTSTSAPGQTIANLVTVPVGAGGAIDLFNLFGRTDLVADVVGYYTPAVRRTRSWPWARRASSTPATAPAVRHAAGVPARPDRLTVDGVSPRPGQRHRRWCST